MDLYDQIFPFLDQNNVYPIVGLCRANDNSKVLKSIEDDFKEYKIQYFDNMGADVWPFLEQLQQIEEPYFVKIHTKRNDEWRNSLVSDLFNNMKSNTDLLDQQEIMRPWNKIGKNDIGMIANRDCIVRSHENTNGGHIREMCGLLKIDYDKVKLTRYVSGTMFMSRTDIFKKYFNHDVMSELSQRMESGVISDTYQGTYTHALERIFGYIITNEQMRIISPRCQKT